MCVCVCTYKHVFVSRWGPNVLTGIEILGIAICYYYFYLFVLFFILKKPQGASKSHFFGLIVKVLVRSGRHKSSKKQLCVWLREGERESEYVQ